jgi:hypothetical protein
MDTEARPSDGDLFYKDLIQSYVSTPRFVERPWLAERIEAKLAEPDCRFLLLTAEPGAGKTAFMAWLAHQHPDWCRYFIRRDQRTRLGDVGAHSFLLQVGFQLATIHPDLFKQEQIKTVVEQRIGTAASSEIIGAEISKMFASPFYKKVIQIQQQVTLSKNTSIVGVHIGEFYANERDLPIENLQFMALFDPAKAMMKQIQGATEHLDQQIVVLIDALDELRYQDSELSLLKWLTNCPELPGSLRFVLTCRPDDDLLRIFRGNQQGRIGEISIAEENPDVKKDLMRYTRFLVEMPEVNQTLIEMHQDLDTFTRQAVTKANGNFGYLGAIGRALDEAICQNQQEVLKEILKLSELPNTLQDLYAFFLGKIKDAVTKEKVPVEDAESEIGFVPVWSAVYKPILGILSVALEPLTPTQIQKLGLIQAEFDYITRAIEKLRQFLDQSGNCYRLYHSTLPEFFTSQKAKERTDYSYCYVDAIKQNQRIVNYYQAGKKSWAEVDLKEIVEDDYGRRHLAQHLVKAGLAQELHLLLALEKDGKPAWFKLKDDKGETAEFLDDLELAWAEADKAYNCERGKSIGLQCRYALIKASINSLAEIPLKLMLALIKHQYWQPIKVFTYALQVPDPKQRCEILTAIANQLADTDPLKAQVLKSALGAAQDIKYEAEQVEALMALAIYIPESRSQALEVAQAIKSEYSRTLVLTAMADKLPPDLLPNALKVAQDIQCEQYRAKVLECLVDKLSSDLFSQILEATLAIQSESDRASVLRVISQSKALPPDLRPQVLESTLLIQDECQRMVVLKSLVNSLPTDLLGKALEAILEIQDDAERAWGLIALADQCSLGLLPQALQSALKVQNEVKRFTILTVLAKKFPEALTHLLETAQTLLDQTDDEDTDLIVHLFWDSFEGTDVFAILGEKIPETLLPQVLKVALDIKDDACRAHALTALLDRLPETLPMALEAVQAIGNEFSRSDALNELVEKLTPELLSKTLEVVETLQDQRYRVQVLTNLSRKRPKIFPTALDTALSIQDEFERSRAFILLADKLSPDLLPKVLKSVSSIQDEGNLAQVWVALAEKFPQVLPNAMKAAQTIQDDYARADTLATLAYSLPAALPFALDAAEAFPGYQISHAQALIDLAAKLTPDLLAKAVNKKPSLLSQALEATQAIQDESFRARTLIELTKKLTPDCYSKALEVALTIQEKENRINPLTAISNYLPAGIPYALESVQSIQDELDRVLLVAALANGLWGGVLDEAIGIVLSLKDDILRGQALTLMVNRVPKVLPDALQALLPVSNEYVHSEDACGRADALKKLFDELKPDLLEQALEIVLAIQDVDCRRQALNALLQKLPKALPHTLEAIQTLEGDYSRNNALRDVANKVTLDFLPNVLEIVQTIQEEHYRSDILVFLLQKFPVNSLPLFQKVAEEIKNETLRNCVLIAIADKSSEDSILFLEKLKAIQQESERTELMLASVDKISQEMLPESRDMALAMNNEANCAKVLVKLSERFPEVLPEALASALAIRNERECVETLIALANKQPEVVSQALDVVARDSWYDGDGERAQAFAALADKLPSRLLSKALDVAQSIRYEDYRALALTALVNQLPEVLPQAVEASKAIQNKHSRARILASLSFFLIHTAERDRLWQNLLHCLALRTRPELLNDLKSLAPVAIDLGGEVAAESGLQAVLDVAKWWP